MALRRKNASDTAKGGSKALTDSVSTTGTSGTTGTTAAVEVDEVVRKQLSSDFGANPALRLMQNAVTNTPLAKVAQDRQITVGIDTSMSNKLDDWKVSNQKRSGRCWLFAGLNLLRAGLAKKLDSKDFELSQNYLHYWDKLEKANYFLQSMVELAGEDLDDRTVHHLLSDPIGDGGQWNMFVALVNKYGVVPKYAMPETDSSSATGPMNGSLESLLRTGARRIRTAANAGDTAALDAARADTLAGVHRILTIHLGTPPESFVWQHNDSENKFTGHGEMTPLEFARTNLDIDLDSYVCLVNDPRESSPYGKTFTVDRLGNVVGAEAVTYLNAEIDVLREVAKDSIVAGEPVWFGCDTSKQCNADLGIWDANLYDYDSVYDVELDLSKAERLQYGDSLMTHAMLLVGVDIAEGDVRRWRVENSWGDEKADKGFYTMNDSWFDDYVFEVAVHVDRLPAEYRKALKGEPQVLPAWDPMGALA